MGYHPKMNRELYRLPAACPTVQESIPQVYCELPQGFGHFQFAKRVSLEPQRVGNFHEEFITEFNRHCLQAVLTECAKREAPSCHKHALYSIAPLYPKTDFYRGVPASEWHYRDIGTKSYSIYLDVTNTFALFYRGIPQLTFGFERSGVSICIFEQIQLVHPFTRNKYGELKRPAPDGLFRFDIDRLKVRIAEEWAILNGCSLLLVAKATSNRAAVDLSSTFSIDKAKQMYDAPFERNAYVTRLLYDREFWFKDLSAKIGEIELKAYRQLPSPS
jgi:hypothetical protein